MWPFAWKGTNRVETPVDKAGCRQLSLVYWHEQYLGWVASTGEKKVQVHSTGEKKINLSETYFNYDRA